MCRNQSEETAMNLDFLPPEIVLKIFSFLEPSSHLDLALTSRRLFQQAEYILAQHREYHNVHTVYTDKSSENALGRLSLIVQKPIRAWHIHVFQLFDHEEVAGVHDDGTSLSPIADSPTSFISQNELALVVEQIHNVLRPFPVDTSLCIGGIFTGNADMVDLISFLLCSRVNTITFSNLKAHGDHENYRRNVWRTSLFPHPCGNLFTDFIQGLHSISASLWPAAFRSLRNVAVGAGWNHSNPQIAPSVITPLFLLPNLETVYIGGLHLVDGDDYLEEQPTLALPPRSSSVQNICIDGAGHYVVFNVVRSWCASARVLKTLVFNSCEFCHLDVILENYAHEADKFIEHLVYSEHPQLRVGHCETHHLIALNHCEALKTVMMDMEDIRYAATGYCDSLNGNPGDPDWYDEYVRFVPHVFPESVETLILTFASPVSLSRKDIKAIDGALAAYLESDRCPNLRAMHLDLVDINIQPAPPIVQDHGYDGTWFHGTVKCGRDKGIEVYTGRDEGSTARCISEWYNSVFGFAGPMVAGGSHAIF